ncbi:MAG: hypothetical protein DRQ46_09415 [Gammaproteobacteria bacterium]|nr:MAG: hypothetical protein DRQ46_09415 [Gammaproteobacteria bacterium]
MGVKIDITDEVYGRLTVLQDVGRKNNRVLWECRCSCGNIVTVNSNTLRRGNTQSCGCLNKEALTKHGLSQHPLYKVWQKMIDRCENQKAKDYSGYGGRGITVCERWHSIIVFHAWCTANGWKPGLQIDREENDGNYTPENCRFVTRTVNVNNRRVLRNNKTGYTGVCFHKGEGKFQASLYHKGERTYLGYHTASKDAAIARDSFIKTNKLPHKLQVLTK